MFGAGIGRKITPRLSFEADAYMAHRFVSCFDACETDASLFSLAALWRPGDGAWGMELGPAVAHLRTDIGRTGAGVQIALGKIQGTGIRASARYLVRNGPGNAGALTLMGTLRGVR